MFAARGLDNLMTYHQLRPIAVDILSDSWNKTEQESHSAIWLVLPQAHDTILDRLLSSMTKTSLHGSC
jgi:hypothetical protein